MTQPDLVDEIERLTARMQDADLAAIIRKQGFEIERLRADFLEYGNHKPECRGGDGDTQCTCGYLNARAAACQVPLR